MIYMSIVDYYLEPKIPYYLLKRACEPLLISFEQTDDNICVCVDNDTPETVADSLIIELMTFDGKVKKRCSREYPFHKFLRGSGMCSHPFCLNDREILSTNRDL